MTKSSVITVSSQSEFGTISIAFKLAKRLEGGSVVMLFGDLGAGKTAFVRGLVNGMGGDGEEVSSPTFTIIQSYSGRLDIQHVDLYRLEPSEVWDLGLDELLTDNSVLVIEWADRLPLIPKGAISVRIEDLGGDNREIRIIEEEDD